MASITFAYYETTVFLGTQQQIVKSIKNLRVILKIVLTANLDTNAPKVKIPHFRVFQSLFKEKSKFCNSKTWIFRKSNLTLNFCLQLGFIVKIDSVINA